MTGYGRAECTRGEITCVVEIRSVNNRFMDISARLPKRFSGFSDSARKRIKKKFSRGSFDVSVSFNGRENGNEPCLQPNIELAKQYMNSVETLKKELNMEGGVTLDALLSLKDILFCEKAEEDMDAYKEILEETLDQAIHALKEMRAAEGEIISSDVSNRLETIREKAEKIKDQQARIVQDYRDRLAERIKQLVEEINVDQGRIAQEAAIFAERADITEEITRLECHIDQTKSHLGQGGTIGRKLDFILQEMNRETNTLLSKVPDYSCSNEAIEIKCELEKMREQVQNIE
jgi:uncharacterized protein (TIGR00255 family)